MSAVVVEETEIPLDFFRRRWPAHLGEVIFHVVVNGYIQREPGVRCAVCRRSFKTVSRNGKARVLRAHRRCRL